jgi:2-polyprenyl-3-methyl-5-hydroxy-6-metoxy-1,4-benzoquinol methylase
MERRLHAKEINHNHVRPIADYLVPMCEGKAEVCIADLGSGPICCVGTLCDGKTITVIASDFSAKEYADMCEAQGIVRIVPVEYQHMESLTYPDASVDIVHCVNTLDHTQNPRRCLSEMHRICKPGGWVYLKHIENEGLKQNYRGLHGWNVAMVNGEVIVWNPTDSFALSTYFPGYQVTNAEHVITVTWKKPDA